MSEKEATAYDEKLKLPGSSPEEQREIVLRLLKLTSDLRGLNLQHADLNGLHLDRLDMRGVDLHGANLRGAKFNLTDLGSARLSRADLNEVRFLHTDLRYADLRGASLKYSYIRQSSFCDTCLDQANLNKANIRNVDFSHCSMDQATFTSAQLTDVTVSRMSLETANLDPIREDVRDLLKPYQVDEIVGLLAALYAGKVDGEVYEGQCSCLVGTLADVGKHNLWGLPKDADRPAERWTMGITPGHCAPEYPLAGIMASWIEEVLIERGFNPGILVDHVDHADIRTATVNECEATAIRLLKRARRIRDEWVDPNEVDE